MDAKQHQSNRPPIFGLILAVIAMVLAACGANTQSAPATATNLARESISVQLAWVHEYSSAGFYAAEKNGHFKAQNLDVRLEAGGFGAAGYIEPIAQVANGTLDFGVASASSIIQARASGTPIVGIAALFQRSPLAVIALDKTGINRPQDLAGHTVSVADGGARQLYDALLNAQKIDPSKVKTTSRTNYGIDPLTKGEIDAMVGWVNNEGVQLRENGQNASILLLSDYGIDSYELILFTTEKTIAERPGVVKRFLQATLEGWQDVINNPNQAAGLALDYDKALDLASQQRRLQVTLPLLHPAGTKLGTMHPEVWAFTHQMLLDQKVLKQPIDLNHAYTLNFLNEVSLP